MTRGWRVICWLTGVMLMAVAAEAAVTLHGLFTDNMVLQRETPVPVYGTATPGEAVTVTLGAQQATATATADGKWKATLPAMPAGGPFTLVVAGKEQTLTLQNVMVGEVWVASGQSNMAMGLAECYNTKEEAALADYPMIRMFTVGSMVATTPQENAPGTWEVCSPQTVPRFSACGYFFARKLWRDLQIPIGIIHSSVGGTWAESWTSEAAMQGDADFAPIFQRYAEMLAKYPQEKEAYSVKLKQWEEAVAQAAAENKPKPPKPAAPQDPTLQTIRPGGLFNGKIAPLLQYRIRGVIWYQGEYNSERCEQYRKLFRVLIRDWRARWGQGDFPFLYVQLANLDIQPQPNLAHYDEMREAQMMALAEPNTGMAVVCDVGSATNIHAPNKAEMGRRLGLLALNQVYGKKDVVCYGPLYKGYTVEGNKIRIRFDHVDGGLVSRTGEVVTSFVIAGENKKFVPAAARIDGDTVVVWSLDVPNPVAVRYAWADNPLCSLFNNADLPASPFRTDDWPVATTGKR